MTVLYLESVAGLAGDMFVAACLDAGIVEADEIRRIPAQLGFGDVEVRVTRTHRATMQATHVDVVAAGEAWKAALAPHAGGHAPAHAHGPAHDGPHHHGHHPHEEAHWHVHYADLDRLLAGSALEEEAKAFARRVFRLLAEAEGKAHGVAPEGVAFHEVGAVDSVVDVAMAGYCVSRLAPDRVLASPVRLGRGTIHIAHGVHAVPPPASAALAVGMPLAPVPEGVTREDVELSTPTGLAILKALDPVFVRAWPEGMLRAQGMGAGTMDLGPVPNVLRVAVLDGDAAPAAAAPESALPYDADAVVEICCNLDDQTAERTAWAAETLLALGAVDVWTTAITGKKGRAGSMLSVLAAVPDWPRLADWLLRHTSTFGVRYRSWDRLKLVRRLETRDEEGHRVTFKVGATTTGEVVKEKPEYESVRRVWEAGGPGPPDSGRAGDGP